MFDTRLTLYGNLDYYTEKTEVEKGQRNVSRSRADNGRCIENLSVITTARFFTIMECNSTIQRQILNHSIKSKAVKDVYKMPGKLIRQALCSNPAFSENLTGRNLELIRYVNSPFFSNFL